MAVHYHIRWSSKEVLDWAAFDSREEAKKSAAQLVRPGETYAIEERNESCPRCVKFFALKRAESHPNRTYPWQQAVLDAFKEPSAARRMGKVSAAQQAVSRRLAELTPLDSDEQAAIRAALRTLRSLIPERTGLGEQSQQEKDIA